MKISIIITTFNRLRELKRVLEGLRYQSRLPDEVIVADDGSGPDTAAYVQAFIRECPYPAYHVRHADRGFRAAKIRNEAIKKAQGDYIIFLDGDCIPNRHFVEDHLSLAESGFFFQGKRILINKKLSTCFSQTDVNSFARLLKYSFLRHISNTHHLIRFPLFPAGYSTSHKGIKSCNMGLFKKDIVAVNGFNLDFVGWGREDSELAVRLYHYGLKRKDHPFMAVCFHLWHDENSREQLSVNDQLLKKAMDSNDYFCPNGLVQR